MRGALVVVVLTGVMGMACRSGDAEGTGTGSGAMSGASATEAAITEKFIVAENPYEAMSDCDGCLNDRVETLTFEAGGHYTVVAKSLKDGVVGDVVETVQGKYAVTGGAALADAPPNASTARVVLTPDNGKPPLRLFVSFLAFTGEVPPACFTDPMSVPDKLEEGQTVFPCSPILSTQQDDTGDHRTYLGRANSLLVFPP